MNEEVGSPGERSEASSGGGRQPEVELLRNLRLRQRELKTLLRESNDQWGFEDPVYRFYHQSFKAFGLQDRTEAIVSTLGSIAPDRPLNPWFVEIVAAGTGKKFQPDEKPTRPE